MAPAIEPHTSFHGTGSSFLYASLWPSIGSVWSDNTKPKQNQKRVRILTQVSKLPNTSQTKIQHESELKQ